jgi:hypothetical protein
MLGTDDGINVGSVDGAGVGHASREQVRSSLIKFMVIQLRV